MDPIIAGSIVLVCGVLWVILGIIYSVQNKFSLNIIPIISGSSCIYVGLKLLVII